MAVSAVAVVAAFFATSASAVPLRVSGTPSLSVDTDDQLRAKVGEVLSGFYGQDAPAAAAGDKGKVPGAPLRIQVPEKELDAFVGRLSPSCQSQFGSIIRGEGPALHTFGSPGTGSSAASCTRLNGTICATNAEVSRKQDAQGRSMSSSTHVEGKGCLPDKCMSAGDLEALAGFMHSKAKGAIPAPGVEINLRVDCTGAGGTLVEVGEAAAGKATASGTASSKQEAGGAAASATSGTVKSEKPGAQAIKDAGKDRGAAVGSAGLSAFLGAVLALKLAWSL